MSGAIQTKIARVGRISERHKIGRASTLRDLEFIPTDVIIDDISSDGCRLTAPHPLTPDDRISIGLPGFGMMSAHIVWVEGSCAGIKFSSPLRVQDIDRISAAQTVVAARFIADDMIATPGEPRELAPFSNRARTLLVVGAALGAWVMATGACWLALRAFDYF